MGDLAKTYSPGNIIFNRESLSMKSIITSYT